MDVLASPATCFLFVDQLSEIDCEGVHLLMVALHTLDQRQLDAKLLAVFHAYALLVEGYGSVPYDVCKRLRYAYLGLHCKCRLAVEFVAGLERYAVEDQLDVIARHISTKFK